MQIQETKAGVQQNFVTRFFNEGLCLQDSVVYDLLCLEWQRQADCIELIASENVASLAVLEAIGSVNNNKYAEGYPGRRYYGGCRNIDAMESLAIERACELFGCQYANVQPHSGSQANQAVFMTMMKPGDTFMGMDLRHGGHLSHGAKPNVSGKWFSPCFYGLDPATGRINYDEVEKIALENKPKLIIAGASAYSRILDFERFRAIADACGAVLLVDMAHIAGLVAAKQHPSPFPHAHVVTSTTHKTLRAARGGLILTNDEAIAKKINSSIFPGLQGGPLEQQIAGKAVGFGEALRGEFRDYARAIIENARFLATELKKGGLDIVSGGTDNHLMLLDLRPLNVTGVAAERVLESINIICNKNGIPDDPQPPRITSGIRLGSPAMTTRGFGKAEFAETADIILTCLKQVNQNNELGDVESTALRSRVSALTVRFPNYANLP